MSRSPIRTFIVDDHPAMRAGVAAVLDREDDITVVGAATGGRQMWRTLGPAHPDVVLMDFDLDGEDGVILCHRLKRRPDAPGVVLYSAFADRTLISPAMLAQADALLSKRADAAVVCDAVRDALARRAALGEASARPHRRGDRDDARPRRGGGRGPVEAPRSRARRPELLTSGAIAAFGDGTVPSSPRRRQPPSGRRPALRSAALAARRAIRR
jgi:DNA-binding NarL/FixJ family response regulator